MTAPPPPPPPPAGWYPDPTGKPGQKYWDGQAWHDAAPATASPAYAPTPWDKMKPHLDRARPQVDKAQRFWSALPRQRQFIVAIVAIAGLLVAMAVVASLLGFFGSDRSDAPGHSGSHSAAYDQGYENGNQHVNLTPPGEGDYECNVQSDLVARRDRADWTRGCIDGVHAAEKEPSGKP
jgi:hypothetical protein